MPSNSPCTSPVHSPALNQLLISFFISAIPKLFLALYFSKKNKINTNKTKPTKKTWALQCEAS